MCSSINALSRSISTENFSTTVKILLVYNLPTLICSVMLLLILSRVFFVDKSGGCASLHIFDNQSVGRKYV